MIVNINRVIKQYLPGLHAALFRLKSRSRIWRKIYRELEPETFIGWLGLIVSVLYDTALYCIVPKLALSPKSIFSLNLYSPALKFYVRGVTDDIYNVLPFREMDVHEAILGNLRSGDVFIDGGANIGYYTILGARAVGDGGTVVAIEAAKTTAKVLAYNLEINNITNAIVVNKAIQSNPDLKTTQLVLANGNYGMATVAKPGKNVFTQKLIVNVTTIDNICHQYKHIRMLKLDIEGAEYSALKGAADTLVKTDFTVVECNESMIEIGKLLTQHGFNVRKLNFTTYILSYREKGK